MSITNLTSAKTIIQNVAMADFLEQSSNNSNSTDSNFSGNTQEYYNWLKMLATQYTKPNILDIFSSENPGAGTFLRSLGYFVQITDADKDNLEFLNNLPDADIDNPAKFFDLLEDTITREYDVVIWHNPQVVLTEEQLSVCLEKVTNCLSDEGIMITNIQFPQALIQQFSGKLLQILEKSYNQQNHKSNVFKKITNS